MSKYKKGKLVKATVSGIAPYGIFVNLDEYYSGLIHISEISHGYVKDVHSVANVGDVITVEILDVDDKLSRLKLSIKNIKYKNEFKYNKKIIKETPHGFNTLQYKLPFWIEETQKNYKNTENSIDN